MKPRTQYLVIILLLISIIKCTAFAQNLNLKSANPVKINSKINSSNHSGFITPQKIASNLFATTVYTFGDITIFSYYDSTIVSIYDTSNSIVTTQLLKADTLFSIKLTSGIYKIKGNKSYTALIGDAISSTVMGYFAIDQAGRGVSTKLNTWMMKAYSSDDNFVVFAYNDNTGFTVRNLVTGNLIFAGTLNKGQHYSFKDVAAVPYSTPLQVTGTQPISALSYTDQNYYVPSSNGTFTGTLFYGYSAGNGGWSNSITVTSYADNNNVQITNSVSGDVIRIITLQKGQVFSQTIYSATYWTVSSTAPVTAANIPYVGWTGNYYYLARAIDSTGRGFGKLFYLPTIGSRVDIFSYDPANKITVTLLGFFDQFPYSNTFQLWKGTLGEGEDYNFGSSAGDCVYKIESSGNVSVVQSNGGAGADFMPLLYSLDYPDLAVSGSDIKFSKADSLLKPGDKVDITVTVHNYGSTNASNVSCRAYEGDPDAGGLAPIVGAGNIISIPYSGTGSFTFSYVVPPKPEYRTIVVKVDPENLITESNKSNNKTQKSLKPNADLQSPLSVSVTAPSSLQIIKGTLSPSPFKIRFDVFNSGTLDADNVTVNLVLQNGLTLSSGSLTANLGKIYKNKSNYCEYNILADPKVSGFNFYSATITSSVTNPKTINKAINVPDTVVPAAPVNLAGTVSNGNTVNLSWNQNNEADLSGYYLYYSTDGMNWEGTGANQGPSPILVLNENNYTLSGLPAKDATGTAYWFKLKAFDSSNNLSGESNTVNVQVTNKSTDQVIFYGDHPYIYTVRDGTGYVTGPNSFNDMGKYQRFDVSGPKAVKELHFYYAVKQINGTADNMNIVVRSAAKDGSPGNILLSIPTTTDSINVSQPGVAYNSYTISPALNVTGSFYAGIEWDTTINDAFALISDSTGEGNSAKRAWEKQHDGTFVPLETAWTNMNVDLWISALVSDVTAVENINSIPVSYQLSQNYPNPFNPNTKISWQMPAANFVTLKIYDVLGKEVVTLVNKKLNAGSYNVNWDASKLAGGVYFYRIQAGSFTETKKLILLK